jgi:peptide/nickel transport system substrate-binding protein
MKLGAALVGGRGRARPDAGLSLVRATITVAGAAMVLCLDAGCARKPAAPSRGSRLVVAYASGPPSLLSYMSGDEVSASILRNAYEPLVDFGPTLSLVPCLAESWHNPDERTWVFRLRSGVRLHDGRLLEARHVAAYLERSAHDPAAVRNVGKDLWSVEAPDPHTVVVRTSRPYGWLPNQLTGLPIAVDSEREGALPVGTGPYAVKSWTPRGDTVLEAFAGHRDGPPAIGRLEFRVVGDAQQAVQRLRKGEIDLMVDVPSEQWPTLRANPDVKTLSRAGLRVVFLGLNTLKGSTHKPSPLRDLRVRRAIALALDRKTMIESGLAGNADILDELVPPDVFGYHGGLPPRPFDLGAARQLLANARQARGLHLTLDFVPGRYPNIEAVAEAIVSGLREVGIEVTPKPGDLAGFRQRVAVRHESDLFLMGWLNARGDAATTFENLVQSPRPAGLGGYSTYSNPEVDRLLDEAARPTGFADRKDLLRAVARIVYDDVPVIPLYRQRDLYACAAGLEFTPRIDRRIRGTEIRWQR